MVNPIVVMALLLMPFTSLLTKKVNKISWTEHRSNEEILDKVDENRSLMNTIRQRQKKWLDRVLRSESVSVALLVASQYALPGYGDRRVWVRVPGWPDHCVRL